MNKFLSPWICVIVLTMLHTLAAGQTAPSNDACASPTTLNLNSITNDIYFVISYSHADTVPICGGTNAEKGVWFTFTGTGMKYDFSLCGPQNINGTQLRIFTGSCSALTCIASDTGTCSTRAKITGFQTQHNVVYRMLASQKAASGIGQSRLAIAEYSTPGIVGPNQNVCYGGTPYTITATGFTGPIVKWQRRHVQHYSLPLGTLYQEWIDLPGLMPAYTPTNIYGGMQYRPVILISGNWYPIATPALMSMSPYITNLPTSGSCDCHIKTAATDWVVFFRNGNAVTNSDFMFYMFNHGTGIDLGNTKAKSTNHGAVIIGADSTKFLQRSIAILPTHVGGAYARIFFVFKDAEFQALKASDPSYANKTPNDLKIVRFNGDVATPNAIGEVLPFGYYGPSSYGFPDSHFGALTTNQFGTFFLTFDEYTVAPLPIELAKFVASCAERKRTVEWVTVSETNNWYFTIERSVDATTWETVLPYMAGAGDSNQLLEYSWIDNDPIDEVVYYRLSQTDYDGTKKTFPPISVSCDPSVQLELKIFPNPIVGGIFFAEALFQKGVTNMSVVDMNGRPVITDAIVGNGTVQQLVFNMNEFGAGMYVLKLEDPDGTVRSKKVIVQ